MEFYFIKLSSAFEIHIIQSAMDSKNKKHILLTKKVTFCVSRKNKWDFISNRVDIENITIQNCKKNCMSSQKISDGLLRSLIIESNKFEQYQFITM